MHKLSLLLSIVILALLLTACVGNTTVQSNQTSPTAPAGTSELPPQNPPKDCPLTVPQSPTFMPPAPYNTLNSFKDHFWFGSNSLWTIIPENGIWDGLPYNSSGYTQKILWWRDGYVWTDEPEPNLIVTGERLDAEAPLIRASKATNAYASDIGSAMLVGMDFPTTGCWKITGKYNDNTELSFVIWVMPP